MGKEKLVCERIGFCLRGAFQDLEAISHRPCSVTATSSCFGMDASTNCHLATECMPGCSQFYPEVTIS